VLYRPWLGLRMSTTAIPRPLQQESARAAWSRYAIVSSALALFVVILLIPLSPGLYEEAVQRFLLPDYESEFGFHGGWVRPAESEYSVFGIASVAPGGRLDRAGVKSGDIPVYGPTALYEALKDSTQGRRGRFMVVSRVDDWFKDRQKAREITLDPR
jgi:hypothetical protein